MRKIRKQKQTCYVYMCVQCSNKNKFCIWNLTQLLAVQQESYRGNKIEIFASTGTFIEIYEFILITLGNGIEKLKYFNIHFAYVSCPWLTGGNDLWHYSLLDPIIFKSLRTSSEQNYPIPFTQQSQRLHT